MKFRTCVTILACMSISIWSHASDLSSNRNKKHIMDSIVSTLQRNNESLSAEVDSLNSALAIQSVELDSISSIVTQTNGTVSALADSLNVNISSTKEQIRTKSDTLEQSIRNKSQIGMWIFVILALIVAVAAFVFGRILAKRRTEVESLAAKADKLNEEIVNRLSTEIAQMQNISKEISSFSTATGGGTDTEQKLIITLADRITFMEMTLYKMDSSVRGHKQLSKSIKQMKDNLLANGYELVEMLGKDYHDGMKVTANFLEDENLPEGKQVITGIIKPQINYKGKMIQSAQITVSQNI